MKNQYFGDIYDYIKYGLIRELSRQGKVSTAICWMLTPNDERRDGHRVSYLGDPERWRRYDPAVFDSLHSAVLELGERNIGVLENSGLLPNATFYSHLLTDRSDERRRYFDEFLRLSHGKELVFFDPDNGLEVKSVKYGQKGASRYLFLREVSKSFSAGHSLLVYQHMPPKPREPLIRDLTTGLMRETGSESVYVFRTPRVAFLLVPQISQVKCFAESASRIQTKLGGLLTTCRYTR